MKWQKNKADYLYQKKVQCIPSHRHSSNKITKQWVYVLKPNQIFHHTIIINHHGYVMKCDGNMTEKKFIVTCKVPVLWCIDAYCDEVMERLESFSLALDTRHTYQIQKNIIT